MKYIFKALCLLAIFIGVSAEAQPLNKKQKFTRQDSLRGSITPARAWWDVLHYDVNVTPDYNSRSISGKTIIQYKVVGENRTGYMQIDLQKPLKIDSIYYNGKMYINDPAKPYYNDGNVWFIPLPKAALNSIHTIGIVYHGIPRPAITPPWDGGWVWSKDEKGRPWMTVACQGLGASVWYPCKDHQSDEPDNGASLTITVPDDLVAVANGKLKEKRSDNGKTSWTWEVKSPINTYNLVPYIGKYVNFNDSYSGEKGKLDLDYWVLDYNLEKAKKQFGRDVKPMMKAFEYWFGPYPFYEDGFKMVESSHLGMEHQSAIAYGNHYVNGYYPGFGSEGMDLSGSGWGLKWDYIIIHEAGHEWFGNNITTKDIADMWVHEGFTDYSETIFVEALFGKKAADEYTQGLRNNIQNDIPIIGPYGVNQEGSSDMYYKGNNLIHMIRQIINDDSLFRKLLRGMNEKFYHKTVNSSDIEKYISETSRKDLSKVFDQYLRTIKIPVLEYKIQGDKISYRWNNCVNGFAMPVKLENADEWLYPTTEWKSVTGTADLIKNFAMDKNFYITVKKVQ